MDRRVQKSREAITAALLDLMAERSFDEITVRALAERANVNRGTIYLHYRDKFDLLEKVIEEHIERLRNLCESVWDQTFEEANHVWFDYFAANHRFFSTMLATESANYFRVRFRDLVVAELRREVDVGEEPNRGLTGEVVVQFFASALVGVVEWWITQGMPIPARTLAEQTGRLLDRNF
ncbi:MAG: TetR/AcrR family transcriptional regulator [Firmicutes bacterium]|nr:TetR/AcrR family transcriptional regulator [Bacillota bacterium]